MSVKRAAGENTSESGRSSRICAHRGLRGASSSCSSARQSCLHGTSCGSRSFWDARNSLRRPRPDSFQSTNALQETLLQPPIADHDRRPPRCQYCATPSCAPSSTIDRGNGQLIRELQLRSETTPACGIERGAEKIINPDPTKASGQTGFLCRPPEQLDAARLPQSFRLEPGSHCATPEASWKPLAQRRACSPCMPLPASRVSPPPARPRHQFRTRSHTKPPPLRLVSLTTGSRGARQRVRPWGYWHLMARAGIAQEAVLGFRRDQDDAVVDCFACGGIDGAPGARRDRLCCTPSRVFGGFRERLAHQQGGTSVSQT